MTTHPLNFFMVKWFFCCKHFNLLAKCAKIICMEIIIIGGGASGLMCASICSENKDCHVTLLEKNEKLGKKIYITGKGRCNVTNLCGTDDFLQNVVVGGKFLYSALSNFPPQKTVEFFESNGTKLKVERGRRVFPQSDKASDITKTFAKILAKNNVKIISNCIVRDIRKENERFVVASNKGQFEADMVVVATGGVSYSSTGSTGDGYAFAKSFGHNVISPKPALVPIILKDYDGSLAGLTLKNIQVSLVLKDNSNTKNKSLSEFGELLFTHHGVSGPTVLTISSFANKFNLSGAKLAIDLKPAVSLDELDIRLQNDIAFGAKRELKTALKDYMPQSLIGEFLRHAGVSGAKRLCDLSKTDRANIVRTLKSLVFNINGLDKIDFAVVTSGGIDTREINPKTMESKLVSGLFFVGETLDVDALTGGYNIQIALSTGVAAGKECIKRTVK